MCVGFNKPLALGHLHYGQEKLKSETLESGPTFNQCALIIQSGSTNRLMVDGAECGQNDKNEFNNAD
jgi:hypothetical protein